MPRRPCALPRFLPDRRRRRLREPSGSGTIVIPAAALNASPNNGLGTWAKQVGSITVSANGTKCTTASLTGGSAIDAGGNARIHIGTSDQPAACHEAGATLTFVNANGQTLFEKYTLLPGVTQLLQNFPNEPPVTSGTPPAAPTTATTTATLAPLAPDTGTGSASSSETNTWIALFGTLAAILGVAGIAASRRRP